jgi:hypothetical protein
MDAVDIDLKLTYVLAGWEGSAHDAWILADAIEREDGLSVSEHNYIVNMTHFIVETTHTVITHHVNYTCRQVLPS